MSTGRPCHFYKDGRCKYGSRCDYTHEGGYARADNDFSEDVTPIKDNLHHQVRSFAREMARDLEDYITRDNMYPFTCYGDKGFTMPELQDLSPEEGRFEFWLAEQQNKRSEYMKEIETKSRESAQKCLHLIYNAMSDAVINSIKDELQKYSSKDRRNQEAITSNSNFFTQSDPAGSDSSTFGGVTASSVFGSVSKPTSVFEGGSQPQSQGESIFGGAAAAPNTAASVFGAAKSQPTRTQSVFGAAKPQPSKPQGFFGSTVSQPSQAQSFFGSAPSRAQSVFGSAPPQAQGVFGSAPSQAKNIFGSAPSEAQRVFGGAAPQSSSVFAGSSVLAPGTFGAQKSMFGGSTNSQAASLFSSAKPNAFGFATQQSSEARTLFGKPFTPSEGILTSQAQNSGTISKGLFGKVVVVTTAKEVKRFYTEEDKIGDQDLAAFMAEKFTLDDLPLVLPPQSVCT